MVFGGMKMFRGGELLLNFSFFGGGVCLGVDGSYCVNVMSEVGVVLVKRRDGLVDG